MGRFLDSGFVLLDGLEIKPMGGGVIMIEGSIHCAGDIRVDVRKVLVIVEGDENDLANSMVKTVEYRYNASIPEGAVLRYDNPHITHNTFHHVHRYDVFDGDPIGVVAECEWPHLGDVLTEMQEWMHANWNRLNPTYELGRIRERE